MGRNFKTLAGLLVSLVASEVSFGHSDGHGPQVTGKGPRGGVLAAVVSATQASEKTNAQVVFFAELMLEGEHLKVTLLDADTFELLNILPISGRLINLSKDLNKPEILELIPTLNGFIIPLTSRKNAFEIIWNLPSGKYVSVFSNHLALAN